jgi:hypothetical protein
LKKVFILAITLILSLTTWTILPIKAHAAITNVNTGMTEADIDNAIGNANPGDTILFAPGTYNFDNSITPVTDNLTIEGSGASSTIIRTNNDVFFIMFAVQNLIIKGFTITSTVGDNGIYCGSLLSGTTTGVISDNIINNNEIDNNNYGIYLGGACSFEIKNNNITQSTAPGIGVISITAENNIHDNQIDYNAVGIFLADINPNTNNIIIRNNIISNNNNGIFAADSTASIYQNNIHDNVGDGKTLTAGGGIAAIDSSVQIYGNSITHNSDLAAGGVYIGNLDVEPNGTSHIYNNYIAENSATDGPGGGMISAESMASIFNNTIVNNTATSGIIIGDSSIQSTKLEIKNHVDQNQNLNALQEKLNNNLIKLSNIHANIGASVGGGLLYVSDIQISPLFYNNIVWGNTDGIIYAGETPVVTYNDLQDDPTIIPFHTSTVTGLGNFSLDPMLSGYVLQEGSPNIDTGTSTGAPDNDIDQTSRPQRNGIDIGAYELKALIVILPVTGAIN